MFNPYSCRPIGSARFEEHLMDVQTARYYATEMPEVLSENVWRLCEGSHTPWYHEDPKEEPWMNLYWAVVLSSFIDYLEAYEKKIAMGPDEPAYWVVESRCIDLENFYFRVDPALERIFDRLLIDVCWRGRQEIERCIRRMKLAIGWLRRPDKKTDSAREATEWQKEQKQLRAEKRFKKLFAQMEEQYGIT